MPQSKIRDPHKHPHQDYVPHKKKKGNAIPPAMVFCTLLSLAIAWFAVGEASLWLGVGAVLGMAFGFFLGSQINRSLDKS
ncbi:MAG: hypothetical protein ABIN36_19200 [Ferruginibacter sp.]